MAYNHHDDELYKKYKYYGITENVTTLGLAKPICNLRTNTIKTKTEYFNHYKFEGFYLIRFNSNFLNELKETVIFFGKNHKQLEDNLFIIHYHLKIGYQNHGYPNMNEIIDEYYSVYDSLQKIKFIQRWPELIVYRDMFCEEIFTDIKLSEAEYKICEKFLLKQLNPSIANILKIEHYPKRGFLRRI